MTQALANKQKTHHGIPKDPNHRIPHDSSRRL